MILENKVNISKYQNELEERSTFKDIYGNAFKVCNILSIHLFKFLY